MRLYKIIFLVLLMFELVGCAANGPIFKQVEAPKLGSSLVYIYRPGNFMAGGRDAYFYINNKNVAGLSSEGYTYIYLEPGAHELEQKWPMDMIGFKNLKVPLHIKKNGTNYVRFYVDGGDSCPYDKICFRWSLRQVTEQEALPEISLCRYQPAK